MLIDINSLKLKVNTNKENVYVDLMREVKTDGNVIYTLNHDYYSGYISIYKDGEILKIYTDIKSFSLPYDFTYDFNYMDSMEIMIALKESPEGVLSQKVINYFWTEPFFETDLTKIRSVQNMLIKKKNVHYNLLPIANKNFVVQIKESDDKNILRICISKMYAGSNYIQGDVMLISRADNPYEAIEKNYDYAINNNILDTNIKKNKHYPEALEYLGWCSWDAFRSDIDEEKIVEKINELYEKKVPVRLIMIDAGWQQANGTKILSYYEKPTTFPSGFKSLITKAKKEKNIKYFGIWHTLTGAGHGVKLGSELYNMQKENLYITNSEYYLPGPETHNAYNFFNVLHKYLKGVGFDLIKVDYQGDIQQFLRNSLKTCEKTINLQEGFDMSAKDNFNGDAINCMALNSLNILNHRYTGVARSSDDFFPYVEDDFRKHVMQNAYNSVFLDYLIYSDYDMFWTNHPDAKRAAVLRAISGGPIYVSDKLNETVPEILEPLVDDEGKILRCNNSGKATVDCLYEDKQIVKLFNTVGDCGVVALFNLDGEGTADVALNDFGGKGEYIAYLYFKKEYILFNDKTKISIELKEKEVEIINFYPVFDGNIELGDTSKYISSATKLRKVKVSELPKVIRP